LVYDKKYYQKNKEKFLEWQRVHRKKHRNQILNKRREYDKQNHTHQLAQKREWRLLNKEKYTLQKQKDDAKYRLKYKEKLSIKSKIYHKKHSQIPEVRKHKAEYGKIHSQIPEVKARKKELERIRRKNNPKSNRRASYDLQDAMNNVRQRDKQTCQWQGCGLTFREAPIHVHHIFPRNEYPDLELIEQYMICYCLNHHWMWHKYRGDNYAKLLSSTARDDSFDLVRGRD